MAFLKSKAVEEYRPSVNACQTGDVRVAPFTYTVAAALANADVVGLCKLPARHIPVDCVINVTDLDTNATPTMTFDGGFYKDDGLGTTAVDSNAMITASTSGQAGGLQRMDDGAGLVLAESLDDNSNAADQIFALTVTAIATGATSGTINGWLSYRPYGYDE